MKPELIVAYAPVLGGMVFVLALLVNELAAGDLQPRESEPERGLSEDTLPILLRRDP